MPTRFEVPPRDWWQPLYDDIVAEIFMVRRDARETTRTAWFLAHTLGLDVGSRAFDQCCGIGTLAIPLARTGVHVVGIDQSESYIRRATESAGNLPCSFATADAFVYRTPEPCDAGFNWNTGFGNDPDDGRNREMLRCAFESLKSGGRFLLDYQHVPRVLRTFQHALTHRLPTPEGDIILIREGQVELSAGTLRQRWTFLWPDGRRREQTTLIRLYLPHELTSLLASVGFRDIEYLGGIDGEPLDLDSPRCILLARRPE